MIVRSAQGKDVSSWQSPLRPRVDTDGYDFVFVRATIGDGTLSISSNQGGAVTDGVDGNFEHNWGVLNDANIIRGAYHFLDPELSIAAQSQLFSRTVKHAGLKPGDILICDSEMIAANIDAITLMFCNNIAALVPVSNPVLVYTDNYVGQYLASCTKYPLWFAWPEDTAPPSSMLAPWSDWTFWQWGTEGGTDTDAFNGTSDSLKRWLWSYAPTRKQAARSKTMYMIEVPKSEVPQGEPWPGVFLLCSDGSLHHVEPPTAGVDNVAAFTRLGIPGPEPVSWAQYQRLLTGTTA